MNNKSAMDPQWAWAPFEPTQEMVWNHSLAAHLFRRAGFGATAAELNEAVVLSPREVVRELVQESDESPSFRSSADTLARTVVSTRDARQLSAAWVYRLMYTPSQLLEKMTLFWHGHFATGAEKVQDAEMMWSQNQMLRNDALGHFDVLVQAIAKDPAMLIYLDSAKNRKSHPNENFARELMELFCLGEGNYTESDVLELARCFTGWEIKNKRFRKNTYQHDSGEKTVLGESGNFDGEQAIERVLEQEEMPRFICRKLYRYFVADEPQPSEDLIAPLARLFRESNLSLKPVVECILGSNLFFSQHAFGRKIRSPVELVLGWLRSLEGTSNTIKIANGLTRLGQGLFFPPNVKGWDGGRTWINSSTLLGRANLLQEIINDETTQYAGGKLVDFFDQHDCRSAEASFTWLEKSLLAVPCSPSIRARIVSEVESDAWGESAARELVFKLATVPEFQLA